jgi:hypothetical protein
VVRLYFFCSIINNRLFRCKVTANERKSKIKLVLILIFPNAA